MNPSSNGNIFYQHLLPLQNSHPILKHTAQHAWVAIVLIFAFIIIVALKISSSAKLIKVLQATYNSQVQSQLEREEFNLFRSHAVLLNILHLITLSLLIYKINSFYKLVYTEYSSLAQYLFFIFIILTVYCFKFIINKVLIILTNETKSIYEFEYNCFIINHATGIFLFPWLVLAELSRFNPIIFVSGGLVVCLFSVFIKWYRGLLIGLFKDGVGILQILTYFCTLEILPILVLAKYLIETF